MYSAEMNAGVILHTFTEGKHYVNDLAHSVYCSCGAETIDAQWARISPLCDQEISPQSPPAQVHENIIQGLPNSFFADNKISISYMHETILCPYRIRFDHIKQIPDQTSGVATRAMTNKDDLDKNNHTGVKTHKASSSDNPLPTPKKKSLKTPQYSRENKEGWQQHPPLPP